MQWPMLFDTLNCGLLYVCFRSVSTDVTDGIKKWKRHALSAQNYLVMKTK